MSSHILGPAGIRRRMDEIQSRIDSLSRSSGASDPSFADHLSGAIGKNGTAPLSPFAGGLSLSPDAKKFSSMARAAAAKHGLDPDLYDSVIQVESGYDPAARSRTGALGLAQLMPGTASSLNVNPLDPEQCVDGGARYLSSLMDKYKDPELALAAYNAGPGAVDRAGGMPNYKETQAYVRKVLDLAQRKAAP